MNRFFLTPILLLTLVFGCRQPVSVPPAVVPEVVVEDVVVREVQPYITATGYTAAYEFVEVPARVSGFLTAIRCVSGDFVKAGDPLFTIEPDQYQADVKSAEAALASAKAQLKLAEADLGRTKMLVPSGAKTEQDLQTDEAKRDVAAAGVMTAEAALAAAQLKLSYTDVRSPIPGKVDKNFVDLGNLVGPIGEHNILTTVARMDPLYVYFDVSDSQFNAVRQAALDQKAPEILKLMERIKKLDENPSPGTTRNVAPQVPVTEKKPESKKPHIAFEMSLIQGAGAATGDFPYKGIIDMAGNTIDKTTGQVTIRGIIDNPNYTIFPGQICRVRIPAWKIPDAVLVKQEAVGTDLNQRYVYVVNEKNVAHRRIVELGDEQPDGTRVVTKGLQKGERYVAAGIQKTRDGITVKPK